jgi:hypothetical protein
MEAEFPIEEIEDRDLYLKYIKSQDKLIPVEEMIKREAKKARFHTLKMIDSEFGSTERKFHCELAKRCLSRPAPDS